MLKRILLLSLLSLLYLPPGVSWAHHSFAAWFDRGKTGTIEGVVVEVWFRNPHIKYYIEVTNKNGAKEIWNALGGPASHLIRRGWNKKSVVVGDKITVSGTLAREEGTKLIAISKVVTSDGEELKLAPPQYDRK